MGKISRHKARELAREMGLDDDASVHSEGVARRAEAVCQILKAGGQELDSELLVCAALLHDVGLSHPHGLDHGKVSAELLAQKGLSEIAALVRVHALPQSAELSMEAKVLIYADTTTGPDGKAIDPMQKLEFLHRLSMEWKNKEERTAALEAYEVKRRIVSEIDILIKQAMAVA
jgi:putative nucleotidyltransferase with HDIG domain